MHHLMQSVIHHLQGMPAAQALLLVAVGMMLESMCMPIPSEVILPVAGWWAEEGKFGPEPQGFLVAFVAVTAGCLIGSSLAYLIGYRGGYPLVERFGRYILVTPHRLERAQKWIDRYGPGAIVVARLVTGVRALISLPVGILKMDYHRFLLFTFLGCGIWNTLAMYLGFRFGREVEHLLHRMSMGMLVLVLIVLVGAVSIYFWKTHLAPPAETPADGGRP